MKHLLRGLEQTKSYSYNGLTHNSLCSFSLYGYEDNLLKIFNNAFNAYAQQEPANYWYYIQDYKKSDYETILFLILKSMYFLPLEYSDKVIDYIINTPHLYYVGYNSDSSYLTTVLLNKFTQKCSEDLLKKLIKQILNYKDNYEYEYFKRLKINKSLEYSPIDHTQAKFLDSLNKERLFKYPEAISKLLELQRKFRNTVFFKKPKGIQGGLVVSPIPKENAKKMTLPQWKNAIYRHIQPDSIGISPCSGGAFQLSQVMEEIIKQEPLKFKNFIYELDVQRTSPFYINAILKGLASLDGYYETKENLIKYCLKINDKEFNHSIVELLSSLIDITGVHLSEYCIDLITQYIINPKYNDEWDNDDIDFVAINCTNGKASRLLQKIFSKDINFKDRFNIVFDKIDSLSLATKVAFIIPLYALYNADRDFALSVLERFIISDKKMLESKYVREFIGQNAFLENFEFYFDLLQKVDCDVPDVKKIYCGDVYSL